VPDVVDLPEGTLGLRGRALKVLTRDVIRGTPARPRGDIMSAVWTTVGCGTIQTLVLVHLPRIKRSTYSSQKQGCLTNFTWTSGPCLVATRGAKASLRSRVWIKTHRFWRTRRYQNTR
jgi:hypothetical protein